MTQRMITLGVLWMETFAKRTWKREFQNSDLGGLFIEPLAFHNIFQSPKQLVLDKVITGKRGKHHGEMREEGSWQVEMCMRMRTTNKQTV